MYDDFAPKMARVLTEYSVQIKPGDSAFIAGNTVSEPLIVALYEAILRRGGNPVVHVGLPQLNELRLMLASDDQL